MQTTTFRTATVADIDALVLLVTSAYRGDSSRVGWTTEADILEGARIDPAVLRDDILRERSLVLVVEQDERLVACAHIADDHGAGYFGMFAVDPSLQGSGLGKTLLAEAERLVHRQWQLPVLRMTVIDVRDELIAFYERRGYRRTGIVKPFPYGDERFGIPLRQDLRFEVLEKQLNGPTP
ncbi:GNAT family N-acetyltransferase [Xanthomonas citri pv. glycines]|uniref:GNAT family N-acetyltransferase n=1 Tax=Xanthomonas campestris pv. glycines TaxID=473421 RepID=A0AAX0HZR2_XANCG|nr:MULTISPECIES: GNAT family N-acetyltransferase [Xanthomonas]OOW51142.1 GCN5 family acetyltransferase [Xanthomonas campestris pv. centellae]AOY62299.1 N-acetyltransferase [Xanthomonas citri pv. glycines str. 8ra]ARV24010.1 GCN5 family acetyltransferase [Xanthomonas citri pv. glycines str. 12-2]EWC51852.1 acetyltransferase [Xanthomonas citri pv. glycines str. 8ra]MBE0315228.1 GNAT family N-acetyltransferase [Xanthomonas citri pv. punicae]